MVHGASKYLLRALVSKAQKLGQFAFCGVFSLIEGCIFKYASLFQNERRFMNKFVIIFLVCIGLMGSACRSVAIRLPVPSRRSRRR